MPPLANSPPKKPWLPAIAEAWKEKRLFDQPLIELQKSPERDWLEALLRDAKKESSWKDFDDQVVFEDGNLTELFSEKSVSQVEQTVEDGLRAWLETHIAQTGEMPAVFRTALDNGFRLSTDSEERVRFFQIYALFFRERLKADTPSFRASLGKILADLQSSVSDLPNADELRDLISTCQQNSETLDEDRLFHRVATSFGIRLSRVVRTLESHLQRLEGKLDQLRGRLEYLIGGLKIVPYKPPPPATKEIDLLKPQHRSIELIGREEHLASLLTWARSNRGISLRTLCGGAGAGKTRLAIEFLVRLERDEPEKWEAGFVRGESLLNFDRNKDWADFAWQKPTLIIVDYAAVLAEPLRNWISELAGRTHDRPPLRILLLERQASETEGWLRQILASGDSWSGGDVASLFDPLEPVRIQRLSGSDQRRLVLAAALAAAAEMAEQTQPDLPEPGEDAEFDRRLESESLWEDPLYLMMAALVAVPSGLAAALCLSRVELATDVARRELGRIRRFAPDGESPVAKAALTHLAAYATLARGLSAEQARDAAEEELAAQGWQWNGGPGHLAALLHEILPAEDGAVAFVSPDILGEALILEVFSNRLSGDQQNAAVLRGVRQAGKAAIGVVIRTAQDFAPADRSEPLNWLEKLIEEGMAEEPSLLVEIEGAMPHQTVALREIAARVTGLLIRKLEEPEGGGGGSNEIEIARILNNHSLRLSDLGQRESALSACERAVEIYEKLAEARPDAFMPYLGMSLNNLANLLSELGQRESALSACERGVEIYEKLAEARPDAFMPDLGMSLNNLANRLSALGQRESALRACERAVEIYEKLAEARPDAIMPDLGMSLNNLANLLSELGQRESALSACERGVEIYEKLAEARPDAFLPDLGMSLNNLSAFFSALGQREAALSACERAVEIYKKLAEARPDAFLPDLGMSLNNLANGLSELGQREAALSACERAVEIREKLAEARPDAIMPDLGMSLNNLANRLRDLGQREAALSACERAVEIYEKLAEARPDAFLPDLGMSLNNLSAFFSELGQRESALSACERAVEIREKLAEARPDAFMPYLAASLNNLANLLSELGQREAALSACERAVEIYEKLAEARPDAFMPDLAGSLNNLANLLSALGQRESALSACERAVEIREKLAEARPDAFMPDLARSMGMLGSIHRANGCPGKASAAFLQGIGKLRRPFLALPAAFAPVMVTLLRLYLESCLEAEMEPEQEDLMEILGVFQAMSGEGAEDA